MTQPSRLIVVSNRLPLTLKRKGGRSRAERSAGGLVTALDPVFQRSEGLWVGWPGELSEDDGDSAALLERWEREKGFASVRLPHHLADAFYNGYPNETLWPLFHGFPSRMEFRPESWSAFVEGNRRFADAVLERLRPGDRVWVHDYHLLLLPRMLREASPETPIGFFLHIPFPSSEDFRITPRREELLHGVLGADYIAFQTHLHLQHFRSCLLRVLGLPSEMDRVRVEGRVAHVGALPIGIVPEEFTQLIDSDSGVQSAMSELRRRYEGRRVLLSVDRLDYTKGIPERLRTYRRLLNHAPELRGQVVLIQIAVPSRERIGRYKELKREVNELVGEINGQYATPEWTPLVYIRRPIPRKELVALYATAALGWVTPLRDGMNLVAKEYVACQRGADGVLLLSEFAGAASEMGEAFHVNPYDAEFVASEVRRTLALPTEVRSERMEALYRRVVRNDARSWSARFLEALDRAADSRGPGRAKAPPELPIDEAIAASRASRERLLILDYDGALVARSGFPSDALPTGELRETLAALAAKPGHRVAVVSTHAARRVEAWLGGLSGLWLAAENGAVFRAPDSDHWQPLHAPRAADWKSRVEPVLEHFTDRTPGSHIEEREHSLLWRYHTAEPGFFEWLANELQATLAELLTDTDLTVVRGTNSLEVRHTWATKMEVLGRLQASGPQPDFLLAIGDASDDEDLFAHIADDAWTVHVGPGRSRARFRLPDPAGVQTFLGALAS